MQTFIEFLQTEATEPTLKKEGEMNEFLGLGKKKPVKPKFKPIRNPKDSSAYRTDHSYNNGDIEPSSVPVFKPSWQNAR